MTLPRVNKLFISVLFMCFAIITSAQHEGHENTHDESEPFVAGDFIMHHIADANEIHFFGDENHPLGNYSLPLPIIIYVQGKGFDFFMSNLFHAVHDAEGGHGAHAIKTATGPNTGTVYLKDSENGIYAESHVVVNPETGVEDVNQTAIWDISITKSVFGMLMVLTIMILMLRSMAKSYARRPGQAPTGLANVFEPLVLFVRDDIANPIIGKEKAGKFMPFLLTAFFFIVACNLLGLFPFLGAFNITGTIGVTIVLATIVFVITTINANKHYWGHLVSPPGVPGFVKLIVVPIELFGIFLKPTVLMIRLTANISAGHIIILSFVSLIYIFNETYGAAGGIGIGIFSTLFMIFMYFLELLVAFLQAYVFTLLASIYFAEATHEPHH
jgi:F-type H+-transporting ATPase subunit a